jgi:tetratricopeptide (TPR) repeat protein
MNVRPGDGNSGAEERPILRRWAVPPAIQREPGESLEGVFILDELPDGPGVLLWLALRDVLLWGEAESDQRPTLFAEGAAGRRRRLGPPAEALHDAWSRLCLLLQPEGLRAADVRGACEQVAAWAAGTGALRTALVFTQAVARIQPESGAAALATGVAAARAGQLSRARTWYQRAIAVSRRSREWDAYTAALLELGRVLQAERRLGDARATLYKALRSVRRHGVPGARAEAMHRLSQVLRASGQPVTADRLGLHALRAYPRGSEPQTRLMMELGRAWVEAGDAERAIPLLRTACTRYGESREAAEGLALLARAWAVTGNRELFAEAWSRVWSIVRHLPDGTVPPRVNEDLGIAANALGDTERLRRIAAPPEDAQGNA